MKSLLDFLSMSDPNVRYVVLGSMLLACSSALVGTFTFLKKKALIGDAVAHGVLPGICLAFILSGTKNPFYLIIGAFVTGWISLWVIDMITSYSKIKQDAAIGLVLSVFFGIGILLLTYIQKSDNANQSGLEHFLFGNAAALVEQDALIFGIIAIILAIFVFLFLKEFTLISFDENYAKSIGFPVRALELLLTTLTVLAVVIGIQAVGVILMAAMLITPAAAARYWTDRLKVMLLLAVAFSMFCSIGGAYISYISPSMPTGPWIVMMLSAIALASFFLAPKKGIISRYSHQRNLKIRMLEENILKLFYQLGEKGGDIFKMRTFNELMEKRNFEVTSLKKGLMRLKGDGFVGTDGLHWYITQAGKNKGQRILRLHRLWELYLTEYLNIAPDHVHEDAESIEHIITPELERRLEEKLNFPHVDPHDSNIPSRI